MIRLGDILKEIGEASLKPFPLTRKGNLTSFFNSLKKRAEDQYDPNGKEFAYEAVSEKAKYLIKYSCHIRTKQPLIILKPGAGPKQPKWKYEMIAGVGFNIKGAREEKETNLNEVYRLMSTVVESMIDFIKGIPENIRVSEIMISPKADTEDSPSLDSKRGRLYLAYVKKSIDRLPGTWTAYQTRTGIEIRSGDWTGGGVLAKTQNKPEPEDTVAEGEHDPVKPGILKNRLGSLSCAKVRSAKSKLKDKGTHYAKALQRYLNYHCQ